jgi:hypothetical protein
MPHFETSFNPLRPGQLFLNFFMKLTGKMGLRPKLTEINVFFITTSELPTMDQRCQVPKITRGP